MIISIIFRTAYLDSKNLTNFILEKRTRASTCERKEVTGSVYVLVLSILFPNFYFRYLLHNFRESLGWI